MDTAAVEQRVTFHDSMEIMEVDFSDLIFKNSDDVKRVYGTIETMIENTQKNGFHGEL